ncbi:MAG: protein-methionine-sulfoxide reductase heme-binding subunit MsrQ [Halioglobus sp.]
MERSVRIGVFVACLLPFFWILYTAISGSLGPDPAKTLMLFTGEWSLRMLALTLIVSPAYASTGWLLLMKLRRMFGLFAFFYGCVHFFSFAQFYVGWDVSALAKELVERPYITLGFCAWVLMLPLAVTSTRAMQRRLRRNWQRLHRLVYPAAIAACLHLLWQVRSDIGEALFYLVVFCFLLGWRVRRRLERNRRTVAAKASA